MKVTLTRTINNQPNIWQCELKDLPKVPEHPTRPNDMSHQSVGIMICKGDGDTGKALVIYHFPNQYSVFPINEEYLRHGGMDGFINTLRIIGNDELAKLGDSPTGAVAEVAANT